MGEYYNQVYRIPVWVVLDLNEELAADMTNYLTDLGGYFQEWPGKTFINTVEAMKNSGWSHAMGLPMPYRFSDHALTVAMVRHVQTLFGLNTLLSGTPNRPYHLAVDRVIKDDSDYQKMFDQALALEQPINLSQIFGLAKPKAKVYISSAPVSLDIISKISDNVITIGRGGGNTINSVGKDIEKLKEILDKEIESRLGLTNG